MTFNLKHPDIDRLAQELSEVTGETISEAVIQALKERLEREKRPTRIQMREEIKEIQNRVNRLPRLDNRADEEIIKYNDNGYPV